MSPVRTHDGRASSVLGFTLIELMVVMGIMILIVGLSAPGIVGMKKSRNIVAAGYAISGLLEQARMYAMANNTYVWVGFFEEDGTRSSQVPAVVGNGGRLVMAAVASQSGERYQDVASPASFGLGDGSNPVNLVLISRLIKIDNVRLSGANTSSVTSNNPRRPVVSNGCQVGDSSLQVPKNSAGNFASSICFTFPLGGAGNSAVAQYTFAKVIEFDPQGEASKIGENTTNGSGIPGMMEVALVPMQGGMLDSRYSGANTNKAAVAVQIEGFSGQVRIYLP